MTDVKIPLTAPAIKAYEGKPFLDALKELVANCVILSDETKIVEETKLQLAYFDANGNKRTRILELPGAPDIVLGGDTLGVGTTLPTSPVKPEQILFVLTAQDGLENPGLYFWNTANTPDSWHQIASSLSSLHRFLLGHLTTAQEGGVFNAVTNPSQSSNSVKATLPKSKQVIALDSSGNVLGLVTSYDSTNNRFIARILNGSTFIKNVFLPTTLYSGLDKLVGGFRLSDTEIVVCVLKNSNKKIYPHKLTVSETQEISTFSTSNLLTATTSWGLYEKSVTDFMSSSYVSNTSQMPLQLCLTAESLISERKLYFLDNAINIRAYSYEGLEETDLYIPKNIFNSGGIRSNFNILFLSLLGDILYVCGGSRFLHNVSTSVISAGTYTTEDNTSFFVAIDRFTKTLKPSLNFSIFNPTPTYQTVSPNTLSIESCTSFQVFDNLKKPFFSASYLNSKRYSYGTPNIFQSYSYNNSTYFKTVGINMYQANEDLFVYGNEITKIFFNSKFDFTQVPSKNFPPSLKTASISGDAEIDVINNGSSQTISQNDMGQKFTFSSNLIGTSGSVASLSDGQSLALNTSDVAQNGLPISDNVTKIYFRFSQSSWTADPAGSVRTNFERQLRRLRIGSILQFCLYGVLTRKQVFLVIANPVFDSNGVTLRVRRSFIVDSDQVADNTPNIDGGNKIVVDVFSSPSFELSNRILGAGNLVENTKPSTVSKTTTQIAVKDGHRLRHVTLNDFGNLGGGLTNEQRIKLNATFDEVFNESLSRAFVSALTSSDGEMILTEPTGVTQDKELAVDYEDSNGSNRSAYLATIGVGDWIFVEQGSNSLLFQVEVASNDSENTVRKFLYTNSKALVSGSFSNASATIYFSKKDLTEHLLVDMSNLSTVSSGAKTKLRDALPTGTQLTDANITNDTDLLLGDFDKVSSGEFVEWHDEHHTGLQTLTGYTYTTAGPTQAGQISSSVSGNSRTIQLRPLNNNEKASLKLKLLAGKTFRIVLNATNFLSGKITGGVGESSGQLNFNLNPFTVTGTLTNNHSASLEVESNIMSRSETEAELAKKVPIPSGIATGQAVRKSATGWEAFTPSDGSGGGGSTVKIKTNSSSGRHPSNSLYGGNYTEVIKLNDTIQANKAIIVDCSFFGLFGWITPGSGVQMNGQFQYSFNGSSWTTFGGTIKLAYFSSSPGADMPCFGLRVLNLASSVVGTNTSIHIRFNIARSGAANTGASTGDRFLKVKTYQ